MKAMGEMNEVNDESDVTQGREGQAVAHPSSLISHPSSFDVVILRQDGPGRPSYWERHRVEHESDMNVISALQKIAARARTAEGRPVAPVAWECNCLEEICGACTMLVNGRVRQACTALVDRLLEDRPDRIELRPMSKFPVIRDLVAKSNPHKRRVFTFGVGFDVNVLLLAVDEIPHVVEDVRSAVLLLETGWGEKGEVRARIWLANDLGSNETMLLRPDTTHPVAHALSSREVVTTQAGALGLPTLQGDADAQEILSLCSPPQPAQKKSLFLN